MESLGQRIARFREQAGLTQATFSEACGWESKSRVGNYERDTREPKLDDLRLMARVLGISLSELIGDEANGSLSPSIEDYALIPQYDAQASAGRGILSEHVEIKGGLVFKRDWLSRTGLKERNLHVIYADGMSMEPTISDGDVLLVDTSQIEPKSRCVYAIRRQDNSISVKRLIQSTTGGWLIRSDNEDKRKYPDETATDSEIGDLSIVGRVVWHGGAL